MQPICVLQGKRELVSLLIKVIKMSKYELKSSLAPSLNDLSGPSRRARLSARERKFDGSLPWQRSGTCRRKSSSSFLHGNPQSLLDEVS